MRSLASVSIVSVTASRDLAISDIGSVLPVSSASAVALTVRLQSAVTWSTGANCFIERHGTGTVTITAESGVTLNGVSGGSFEIAGQYAGAWLRRTASDTWVLFGASGFLTAADIDTLAELNAIITDATLIDTGDSRLSDARTPTAHATTHNSGGGDPLTLTNLSGDLAQSRITGLVSALAAKLESTDIDTLAELNAIIADATLVDSADVILEADFSASEGFMRKVSAGTYEAVKTNLSATTDPDVNDDNTAGYVISSRWVNLSNDKEFVALDVTTGAAVWKETTAGAGGGISNVVEDATPQLGGMLDVNGNAIGDGALELLDFSETASAVNHIQIANAATGNGPTLLSVGDDANVDLNFASKGAGVIGLIGNVNVTGSVDGRDLAADGTKLDGIETGADVTDATNVNAAGAVMESDFTAADRYLYSTAISTVAEGVITSDGRNILNSLSASLATLASAFTAASASGAASLAFAEDTDNGGDTATLIAPSDLPASITITLPATSGTLMTSAEIAAAYQPLDALLTAISALTTAADQMIYSTGSDAVAMTSLTSFIRTLLDDANAATARATLLAQAEYYTINNQTGTSYTLVLSDGASTLIRCNNASAITLTVPPNSSVAIPTGASIPIRQVGAGAITLTPGSGVTLNAPQGGTLVTTGAGAQVQIVKVATDTWDVIGQT